MRTTQLASVLGSIAALITLTCCSMETMSGGIPDATSSADSGRDAASGDPAADAQNDSARDTNTADTAVDPPDTSPYASDPKNCGAAGHDCLGRSCSSGMCAVDTVRTNAAVGGGIESFIIRDANLYLVARQSGGTALRRGPVTPGASDSLLFPVTSGFGKYGFLQLETDAIYGISNSTFERYALSGGAKTVLSDRDRASDFLVEDNKAYFIAEGSVNYGTRTVPLTGGTSTAFANSVPGDPRGMVGDKGTDLYIANVVDAIYRVPKSGSPAVKIPITGIASTSSPARLHVNSSWLVMSVFKYSGSVSCESSTWGIYAAPKSGGVAVLITSDIGFSAHAFAIDDDYVYWQAKPCTSGQPSVLRKRRLDGTSAAIDLAVGPKSDTMVGTDAQYLYWIDPLTGMYRTPK